ncbi:GNAT family N-acetyltransferase [Nocardioides sp. CFH 31398]|uniref:GNAT family N-acetyltransferase n=1 Tax=Nocardioides sp. CFH 31398 TaxID=2919579 RepID=UPI001F0505F4|nr:GNAT family N-acetyltransferase [Nocardioides sp. CFH 31398]MCH1865705.1 GNAT family N-acetyltransferase [Nocardioides sp. CFH 31398]
MSRRTVALGPAHVEALETLAACTGWLRAPGGAGDGKADWVRATTADWGTCGLVALAAEEPVGYVVYAPPAHLPGLARLPTAPPSPDALVLAEVWVDPAHRGGGLGRHLVRAGVRDLVDRYGARAPALETFARAGDTRDRRDTGGTDGPDADDPCLRSIGFCEALGFIERRAHPVVTRMRLEPRAALDWRGGVEHALERLRAGVRPAPGAAAGMTRPRA